MCSWFMLWWNRFNLWQQWILVTGEKWRFHTGEAHFRLITNIPMSSYYIVLSRLNWSLNFKVWASKFEAVISFFWSLGLMVVQQAQSTGLLWKNLRYSTCIRIYDSVILTGILFGNVQLVREASIKTWPGFSWITVVLCTLKLLVSEPEIHGLKSKNIKKRAKTDWGKFWKRGL